jgi:hypothetical protein
LVASFYRRVKYASMHLQTWFQTEAHTVAMILFAEALANQ